jgi:predicted transcriptional regulator
MRGDIDQMEIARLVGISQNSMSKWVNDPVMNWKAKRKSFLVTKQEAIRRLYNIIEKLTIKAESDDDGGDTALADKISKYSATLNKLETDASVADIMEV